jgi:pyruvate dehydrogenase E1 component alpha subunit
MKAYSKDFLRELLKTMLRIRLCEESLVKPIIEGAIKCPVHLYSGQEAIATGVCAALSKADHIFGTHRSHGHFIAKGGNIKSLIAEIYGKESGCSKGRGGSMHIIEPETGIKGAVPILAGTIPLALGAALASRIRKDKRISVSFFGDGATGEGVLYESLNFAALKNLPIMFVCENNHYSTHMPIKEIRPPKSIAELGRPFGILSLKIDGNDVLEVFEAAEKAVRLCKNNSGPALIECITYRLRGHVGPDDDIHGAHTDIRPEEEVKKWREKDPIINFEKYLLEKNILPKNNIERIRRQIEKEIDEAHSFAKNSPYPKKTEIEKYVFKQ